MWHTEAFSGNRYDGIEACQCTEIDRIQSHLDQTREKYGRDRYLSLRIDFGKGSRKWQTMVSRKGVQAPRSFREQSVGGEQGDDDERRGQHASPCHRPRGVVKDLDQRDPGWRFRGGCDVPDTETDRDKENKAGHAADVDRPHDGFWRLC